MAIPPDGFAHSITKKQRSHEKQMCLCHTSAAEVVTRIISSLKTVSII
ncbi:hypothetical protein D2M30_1591 [Bacillus amyloliquefaciens]|nr:hypothetical protein D2M30_1591 [Bacillus amyloliquefaciens]